ncbi:PREDICTED: uncharacterized protein LOC104075644 [Fulmarus glacialis]|uniref:uncharacterized protein LOC104075644 n=1 Tax=Fulmarus glacialis TaxID=30455 RepID=UPI00051AFB64|nr:PREDICTED: uncharacterized protein LOC104075644 [Fulmarus glacialis]
MRSHRETRERSRLEILEEEQERDILDRCQVNELQLEPCESTPCEPSEDQEWRRRRLLRDEEAREPNRCRTFEDEGRRHERNLYQTVEVDNRDLCLPGEEASVTDMRVRYIPAEPDVRPEVRVLPQSCEPQTIAYLIHVIQNLNDPEATSYKIVCHQPHDPGQPIYVKKCYVSPQPPAVPGGRSKHPEPRPPRDARETGEPKLPRQRGTPASSSQQNTGDLHEPQERSETGVKKGAHQASASKVGGVKGDPCQAKPKDRRDSQRPKMSDVEEKDRHPQGDASKAARERVPREPESSCQPTETERCIESLLAVFQRYAGREGDNCMLSKREFLAFMNTELAAFTKNQKDPGVLDRMMKKLDLNSDGQLDFQEFLNLIGGIALACHDTLILKAPGP